MIRKLASLLLLMPLLGTELAAVVETDDRTPFYSSEEALHLLEAGKTKCLYDPDTRILTYIGKTGPESIDCFERYREFQVTSLRVTSSGGLVKSAIEGARIIHDERWAVEAVGFCASSCMNYWAPAASSFGSEPDTMLIVHGKPPWRLTSLFGDDEYRQHVRFARSHDLNEDWFGETYRDHSDEISAKIGKPSASNLIVGPCHAKLIAHLGPIDIWWPSSRHELQQFVEDSGIELRVKQCELRGLPD